MRGTPLEVLQKLGGWVDMRYAHLAPSYTAQWVENSRREDERNTKRGTVAIVDEPKPTKSLET